MDRPKVQAIQKVRPVTELVFDFTYPEMVEGFKSAATAVGLPAIVPY